MAARQSAARLPRGCSGRFLSRTATAAEVKQACFGLWQQTPQRSARAVKLAIGPCLVAALVFSGLLMAWPTEVQVVLRVVAGVLFGAVVALRLACTFAARGAKSGGRKVLSTAATVWPVYTLLLPVYREAAVLRELMAALAALDYPPDRLDAKLLVEADDTETLAALKTLSLPAFVEVLHIPPAAPRTKPKALNVGLARARGTFLTIYDAEDRPDPGQLKAAVCAFEAAEAAPGRPLGVVQAPLKIDNARESWIAAQFALEYAIHFGVLLPGPCRLGLPVPLGGTSNHFRTATLRQVGGWDPFNVTEDADLGVRLAALGYRASMIGEPTWEEAPVSFRAWSGQRSRWLKGYLQTWAVMTRQARGLRSVARVSLTACLLGGFMTALLHGPTAVIACLTLVSGVALPVPETTLAACSYGSVLMAGASLRPQARLWLSMPVYWCLQVVPAVRALGELATRPHGWTKTAHGVARQRSCARNPAQAGQISQASATP